MPKYYCKTNSGCFWRDHFWAKGAEINIRPEDKLSDLDKKVLSRHFQTDEIALKKVEDDTIALSQMGRGQAKDFVTLMRSRPRLDDEIPVKESVKEINQPFKAPPGKAS